MRCVGGGCGGVRVCVCVCVFYTLVAEVDQTREFAAVRGVLLLGLLVREPQEPHACVQKQKSRFLDGLSPVLIRSTEHRREM